MRIGLDNASGYDCQSCGACCRGERYGVELRPEEMTQRPELVQSRDGHRFMLRVLGDCAALAHEADGRVRCDVYDDRPQVCRSFEPGSAACLAARRAW